MGWLGWRSSEDEDLIRAIADACAFDKGRNTSVDNIDEFQSDVGPQTFNGDGEHAMGKVKQKFFR